MPQDRLLERIEDLTGFLVRPFSDARTLSHYANRGFILLGLPAAAATVYILSRPELNYPLSRLPQPVSLMLAPLRSLPFSPLRHVPEALTPLSLLPILLYITLAMIPKVRTWIGERVANISFASLFLLIRAGEWCIEHRLPALLIILILTGGLSAGISLEATAANRLALLNHDLTIYLKHAEEFILTDPMARREKRRYDHSSELWRSEFESISFRPGGYRHPAIHLHSLLETIYVAEPDDSWSAHLAGLESELLRIAEKAEEELSPIDRASSQSTFDLIHLLLGKVYSRISSRDPTRYAILALEQFRAVQSPGLRAAARNGEGTALKHLTMAMLTSTNISVPPGICPTISACATKTLDAYSQAADGATPCSFEDRRRLNNTADLLADFATRRRLGRPTPARYHQDPAQQADQIEQTVDSLLACARYEQPLSTHLVTAAQATAAVAAIRIDLGDDASVPVNRSATYLALAAILEPANVGDWDLSFFCGLLGSQEHAEAFRTTLRAALPTESADLRISTLLQNACSTGTP